MCSYCYFYVMLACLFKQCFEKIENGMAFGVKLLAKNVITSSFLKINK